MASFYQLAIDQLADILETVEGVVNSEGESNIHKGKRPEIYNQDIKNALVFGGQVHAWFICREQVEGSFAPSAQVPFGHSHDAHTFGVTLIYGGISAGTQESEREFQEYIERAYDAFMENRSFNFSGSDNRYTPGELESAPHITDFSVSNTRFGVTYQATIYVTPTTRKRRDYN